MAIQMEDTDNWRHRSAEMRCRSCMFYVPKGSSEPMYHFPDKDAPDVRLPPPGPMPPEPPTPIPTVGRCRRHAPRLEGWPVVFDGDWCGDHKLDETKR